LIFTIHRAGLAGNIKIGQQQSRSSGEASSSNDSSNKSNSDKRAAEEFQRAARTKIIAEAVEMRSVKS
jgi:hypothetical protein